MARKRKNRADGTAAAPAAPPAAQEVSSPISQAAPASSLIPGETVGTRTVTILALMMFLAPALGVTHEEMLQDTLKSIIVSFGALSAALFFFWIEGARRDALRWHAAIWLPLLLMAYAMGSMAWSHTYLAAVEAIRWFIFSLLLWLGLNTLSRERLPLLALAVHGGAVVASLWAALQFWTNLPLFPQGPHPASTFVNRNFFAEFAVCTLPFGAVLLARCRRSAEAVLIAASVGLVITAILMTGTRAALISLWLQLALLLPWLAWRYRRQFAFPRWSRAMQVSVLCALLGTVLVLGLIPTGDPKIVEEGRGVTALQRGLQRTESISPSDPSLAIRKIMWRDTLRMIAARPLSGVGAGAWENDIPLYQEESAQLETDYYVHNEYLQLLAEYGAVGWLFLLGLLGWMLAAAWRTLSQRGETAEAEAPWRAVLLCSLASLLLVSNVGFPWRMAATGALFALCLAGVAASDARLGLATPWGVQQITWRPKWSLAAGVFTGAALLLATFISWQAREAEQKIVAATRIALTISASQHPNDPRWDSFKADMLKQLREGIAINPHYRKITPMVADELARWGDWKDATWIWESVLSSRPYIVAILTNVARGYASMGDPAKALPYLERARKLHPKATSVRALEVILLARTGNDAKALALGRQAIDEHVYDFDLANATFMLAWQAGDYELARRAMRMRMIGWPASRAEGYVQLGTMYDQAAHDSAKALEAFREALAVAGDANREPVIARIPASYAAKLGLKPAPSAPAAHTSDKSG